MNRPAPAVARTGDADAFRALTEPYRRELHLHCYRIVGSLEDAEDLVQETLLAAWRGLEAFEGRSSVRTWLYRIATNRSLNAVRAAARRPVPAPTGPPADLPEPTLMTDEVRLQPLPDRWLEGLADHSQPEARYETREAVGLAFTIALHRLPPRQRAAVVLCDVLGFGVAEAADTLEVSPGAVKGALQRARATLDADRPSPGDAVPPSPARERDLVGRFTDALQAGDTAAMVSLMTEDAWLTMPPRPHAYQGRVAIARFFDERARHHGAALRAIPTRAHGQPALACYLPLPSGSTRPAGILVLTVGGAGISAVTRFGGDGLLRHFGLPATLEP
jgi:RNA polymerase sigma-70 factor (TIGR02960 family)